MEKSLKFMKVSSIAMMLAGAAAFTIIPMSWDAAQAKNNNGNGGVHVNNGKGGGNGNRKPRADGDGGSETRGGGNGNQAAHGNGGGNGNQTAHGDGNGRGKPEPEHRRPTPPSSIVITSDTSEEDIDIPRNHGAVASELGWRNAAHASETARANASPNSAVGRVAAYRNAVVRTSELEVDVTTAENELTRLSNLTDAEIAAEFPNGGYEDAVTDATNTLVNAYTALEESPTATETLELIDGSNLSAAAIAELHRLLNI